VRDGTGTPVPALTVIAFPADPQYWRAQSQWIQAGRTDQNGAYSFSAVPIGESVDAIRLDNGQAFASTAGSQLFVASETSPGKFAIVETVKTGDGARTMDVDPTTHKIYLPSAEFGTGAGGRQAPKPGTFMVLVVARQAVR